MISTVIQNAITTAGYDGYPLSAVNDNVAFPFVVHEEKGTPGTLTKDDAAAAATRYSYLVTIGAFAKTPDEAESISAALLPLILALSGTTADNTVIDSVSYEGDTPDYDPELDAYYKLTEFEVLTSTR